MAITKSTPAPLTGGTLWCVTIALSLATFMQMLDSCYWQVGTKNRRIKIIFTFSHFFFAVFINV